MHMANDMYTVVKYWRECVWQKHPEEGRCPLQLFLASACVGIRRDGDLGTSTEEFHLLSTLVGDQ